MVDPGREGIGHGQTSYDEDAGHGIDCAADVRRSVRVKMERRLAEIIAGPQRPTAAVGSHAANGPCTIELTVDVDIEIGELKVDALIWSNRKHVFTEIPKTMENLVFNRDRARASPKKYSIKALTGGYLYFFGEKCDQSLATLKPRLEDLKGAVKGPFMTDCLRMRVEEGRKSICPD